MRAHNITPGMQDPKEESSNTEMVLSAVQFLKQFDRILNSLVISPERALEELNRDWTASQELADVLMSRYKVAFRIGHHFSSEVVNHAKARNIKPLDFPYAEAQRIYREAVKEYSPGAELPLSESEFRSTLNPVAIVQNRRTVGGPQLPEMMRMLALARKQLADQQQWIVGRRTAIDGALTRLNRDFAKLLAP
jgi:argininosuccinate lyase